MGTTVKIQLDPTDKILLKRHLNKNGKAQRHFTHEVRRTCRPYVPNRSGALEGTAIEQTDKIIYDTPYARRQYYENSGKNRSKAPLAGKQWDRRMWQDRGKGIVQSVAKYCGGDAK